jgi:parallel beta-helix repeat protein
MSRNVRILSAISVVCLLLSFVSIAGSPIALADTTSRIYFVDNTGDADLASNPTNACQNDTANNDCSLRQAIERANTDSGNSTINFDRLATTDPNYTAASGGRWTIKPTTQLPALSGGGTTIAGRNDNVSITPRVVIDGSSLAGNAVGFRLNSDGNVLQRLIIVNFSGTTATTGYGIRIFGPPGTPIFDNQVVGCYIGVLPFTSTASPNQRGGILIDTGAGFNRIGGANTNRNIISGNGTALSQGDGITILANTEQNNIESNYIGIAVDDSFNVIAMPNTGYGIQISDSIDNSIGGTNASQRNIISANGLAGIVITGLQATNNSIFSNYIGVGEDGATDRGNGQQGIAILDGANNNTISGSDGAPIVISGNAGYGILFSDVGTNGNKVSGAYIGLDESGTTAVANSLGGVRIQDNAQNNEIGLAALGNVISGNIGYGVSIGRANVGSNNTAGNIVRKNIIGLNFNSLAAVPNTTGGILVDSSAKTTLIGGVVADGNVISGNGSSGSNPTGVVINATAVVSTTITGNTIGLRRAISAGPYNTAAPNVGGGIIANTAAAEVQIGGTLDQANTIAYNSGNGIVIAANATKVAISANSVLTNTLGGISVSSVTSPTIVFNTVRGNQNGAGISLITSPNATIVENTIATNSSGGLLLTDSDDAIIATNTVTSNAQLGVAVTASDRPNIAGNTIEKNTGPGIAVTASPHTTIDNNIVEQNTTVGLSATSTNPITVTSNTFNKTVSGPGISLAGPLSRALIDSNSMQLNGLNGLTVLGVSSTSNITVTANNIRDNTGRGIALSGTMSNIRIEANQVISNTVSGIQVGAGGAAPHPQRVRIINNVISRNGIAPTATSPVGFALQALGIVFDPETSGTPGTATNPNHDIDPPIVSSLAVSQASNGILTGRVLADASSAACTTNPVSGCTIQIFNTDAQVRDGQGAELLSAPITLTTNGYFTTTLGFIPAQLALTATDTNGNTSEFAVFNANPAVSISPGTLINAKPSDVITMTHRITNTGNIAFTKLQVSASTSPSLTAWNLTPTPTGQFSLGVGQSRTVTVTLRLPAGGNPQVNAGVTAPISITLLSNSAGADALTVPPAVHTVTILPRVVLVLSPGLNGNGSPNTVLTYPHSITNSGNVTTTVNFSVATTVGGQPAPTWTTTVSPTSIILGPGQSGGTTVRVTVSSGAQGPPTPSVAQTILTATPVVNGVPDLTAVKTNTNTTTAQLIQAGSIVPDRQQDGAANETVSFEHVVTNNSNGTATFKLQAVSSQGSTITYTSLEPTRVPIVNGNTFTLPNTSGLNQVVVLVNVRVDRRVLPGQRDSITVILTDAVGGVIGGASVQDTVNVTRGLVQPRLWLPWIGKP